MMPEALLELAGRHPLVLGSGSPRRVQLLSEAGIAFRQVVVQIDEDRLPDEEPVAFAVRLAEEKARAVARKCDPDEIILDGDTVVALGGKILSKPNNEQNAIDILGELSGQQHIVCTALALATQDRPLCSGREETKVFFNEVTSDQIKEYVDSGEPLDKAGAYGIQGMGAFLVDRIEGSLDNVVGLPMLLLNRLAREALQLIESSTDDK